jgi:hypothetical protein
MLSCHVPNFDCTQTYDLVLYRMQRGRCTVTNEAVNVSGRKRSIVFYSYYD